MSSRTVGIEKIHAYPSTLTPDIVALPEAPRVAPSKAHTKSAAARVAAPRPAAPLTVRGGAVCPPRAHLRVPIGGSRWGCARRRGGEVPHPNARCAYNPETFE